MSVSMLIKVHRVCSIEEALGFEALGADLIGVSLARDAHFADRRGAGRELARDLARQLRRAQLVIEPDWQTAATDLVAVARESGAPWLQLPVFAAPPPHVRAALVKDGIDLVVSRVDAEHDMDPSWVLGPVRDLGAPEPGLIEVEILPSITGAWRFLTEICPDDPEWLQAGDIEDLAREAGLLLSLDLTPENLPSVRAAIPSARGFSLTLGTLADGVSGLHVFSAEAAARVVEVIARDRG